MKKGNGGDIQENNIEAIIDGMNTNPNCKEIVLIADNYANMRDYTMIKNIKKPVRVIICGNYNGINTQYLDLARATKGSIHTIENDLLNLMNINEGQQIDIGKYTYTISEGKFMLTSKI